MHFDSMCVCFFPFKTCLIFFFFEQNVTLEKSIAMLCSLTNELNVHMAQCYYGCWLHKYEQYFYYGGGVFNARKIQPKTLFIYLMEHKFFALKI